MRASALPCDRSDRLPEGFCSPTSAGRCARAQAMMAQARTRRTRMPPLVWPPPRRSTFPWPSRPASDRPRRSRPASCGCAMPSAFPAQPHQPVVLDDACAIPRVVVGCGYVLIRDARPLARHPRRAPADAVRAGDPFPPDHMATRLGSARPTGGPRSRPPSRVAVGARRAPRRSGGELDARLAFLPCASPTRRGWTR